MWLPIPCNLWTRPVISYFLQRIGKRSWVMKGKCTQEILNRKPRCILKHRIGLEDWSSQSTNPCGRFLLLYNSSTKPGTHLHAKCALNWIFYERVLPFSELNAGVLQNTDSKVKRCLVWPTSRENRRDKWLPSRLPSTNSHVKDIFKSGGFFWQMTTTCYSSDIPQHPPTF